MSFKKFLILPFFFVNITQAMDGLDEKILSGYVPKAKSVKVCKK